MSLWIAELFEQIISKLRHLILVFSPLLSKENLHPLDAPLYVFHAPVLVDFIQLKLTYIVGQEVSLLREICLLIFIQILNGVLL